MFHMLDGSTKSLEDEWDIEDAVFLSSDDSKDLRADVWNLSVCCFPINTSIKMKLKTGIYLYGKIAEISA